MWSWLEGRVRCWGCDQPGKQEPASCWEGRSIASFVSCLISWFSELQDISTIRNSAEGVTELWEKQIWWLWKWAEDVRRRIEARSTRRAHGRIRWLPLARLGLPREWGTQESVDNLLPFDLLAFRTSWICSPHSDVV